MWSILSSYDLPHRIHDTVSYPIRSVNGSTILIYGHEHGIRIVWRGGRPFKARGTSQPDASTRLNGTSTASSGLKPSDGPHSKYGYEPPEQPDFEDEDAPLDAESRLPPVRQFIDLHLGVGVLHLAVPSNIHPDSFGLPRIVNQRILLAAICTDHKVRAISLPIQPPSPEFKGGDDSWAGTRQASLGVGYYGEQVLVINATYQDLPNCIACTLVPSALQHESCTRIDGHGRGNRPGWADEGEGEGNDSGHHLAWDLVIAVHSPELSGTIDVYSRAIRASHNSNEEADSSWWGLDPDRYEGSPGHPAQETQYLSSPASHLSFNPCIYPSPRHSQLLITQAIGQVKLWDVFPNRHRHIRPRRTYDPADREPGVWNITLYAPFSSTPVGIPAPRSSPRKGILSSQWVLDGKAIIVLLSDGEWGVWDLEGTAASWSGRPSGRGSSESRGIHGSAVTAFNLGGRLPSGRPTPPPSTRPSARDALSSTAFTIRTPHTRQRDERKLFSHLPTSSSSTPFSTETGQASGGITVSHVSPRLHGGNDDGSPDDAIVFWHDGILSAIPSLRTYWTTQLTRSRSGGSLFLADGKDRLLRLGTVQLFGERLAAGCAIVPGPVGGGSKGMRPAAAMPMPMPDVVVGGEHRLVVLSVDPTPDEGKPGFGLIVPVHDEPDEAVDERDGGGHLGLAGIDRALSRMQTGRKRGRGSTTGGGRRKVDFAAAV